MNPLAHIPRATAKLTALSDATAEAGSAANATSRRISELSKALATAPASEAANIEHELARMRGRLADQQAKFQARAFLDTRLRNFVQTLPAEISVEAAKPIKAKLAKGTTLNEGVAALRERIKALNSERMLVQQAPLPTADVKKMASDYIAGLQKRGAPRITVNGEEFSIAFEATVPGAHVAKPDVAAIFAWFSGRQLVERLHDAIDAMPRPPKAMTAKAKSERLLQIGAGLAVLENEEEALIEMSEVEGPAIMRRPDADPAAVLGIILRRKATAAA